MALSSRALSPFAHRRRLQLRLLRTSAARSSSSGGGDKDSDSDSGSLRHRLASMARSLAQSIDSGPDNSRPAQGSAFRWRV